MSGTTIGIVGAGSMGVGLALVFARAGLRVRVFDPSPQMTATVAARLAERLAVVVDAGLIEPDVARAAPGRVTVHGDLSEAVGTAALVVECAPEALDLKRQVFAQIETAAPSEAILASTSSAFGASEFASGLDTRTRCLVIHPANPPYLLPVVEIVPAPFTAASIAARAVEILTNAGMTPIALCKEVTGFVYNRLQGAVLREAYCLVRDGVIDVEGLDTIVRDGLGRRWAIIGPFETADLNTRGGIAAHAARLGPGYERMGAERGQHDPWTEDLVAHVTAQRRAILPLDEWEDRTLWRDRRLAALARHLDHEHAAGRQTAALEHIGKERG